MTEPTGHTAADPTAVTTEVIDKAVANLQELLEAKISKDKSTCDEKFESVDEKLSLIERQRVEQKADTEKALQSALNAAKEAVKEQTTASEARTDKSEEQTTKSIDQLGDKFDVAIGGVTSAIADLKDRVGKSESIKQGAAEVKGTQGDSRTLLVAAVSAFVGLCALFASIVIAVPA